MTQYMVDSDQSSINPWKPCYWMKFLGDKPHSKSLSCEGVHGLQDDGPLFVPKEHSCAAFGQAIPAGQVTLDRVFEMLEEGEIHPQNMGGGHDLDQYIDQVFKNKEEWIIKKQKWQADHQLRQDFFSSVSSVLPPELASAVDNFVGDPKECPLTDPAEITDNVRRWFLEVIPEWAVLEGEYNDCYDCIEEFNRLSDRLGVGILYSTAAIEDLREPTTDYTI